MFLLKPRSDKKQNERDEKNELSSRGKVWIVQNLTEGNKISKKQILG